jgi:asparagine synthase (glutamine-hydrolysing)
MCGINVIFDPERALADPRARVGAMDAQMAYRGPDGEGVYAEGPLAMGMRRLSIIDLPGGQQPLYNEDRSLALVCNGEVYNHLELRARLLERGHGFATHSDCEVILHLYEDLGPACLAELRGMFAFALWDTRRQRLFAARDRLGIKPLYVHRRGRLLALSSELKALIGGGLASGGCDPVILADTLDQTFPLSEHRTLATEIERVPPGMFLLVDRRGENLERYWTPRFGGAAGSGEPEPSDGALAESLARAVELHLRSDVPVAVLLSAGIDSAAIAALARRPGSELFALCAGYRGKHRSDERGGAAQTAQALGLPFRELELDAADYPRAFDEIVARCDEPAADIASVAQWALYRACHEAGFKVVLSGLGGDELFFGYPLWNQLGEEMSNGAPGGNGGHGVVRNNTSATRWLGSDELRAASDLGEGRVRALQGPPSAGPDAVYSFLLRSYLVNNGLQLADKLGMASSVEVRVPFLDHIFVEQVLGLPLQRRFRNGETKLLLKRLLVGVLGPEILARPKRGFEPPLTFVREIIAANAERLLDSPWPGPLVRRERLAAALRACLDSSGPQTGPAARLRSGARRVAGRLACGGRDPLSLEWWLYSLIVISRTVESWPKASA